jgi:hypothetical protein
MRRVLAEKERAAAEAKRQQETLLAQELREARQRFEADLAAAQAQAQAQALREEEEEEEAAAAAAMAASMARKKYESPLHGLFEVDMCWISSYCIQRKIILHFVDETYWHRKRIHR